MSLISLKNDLSNKIILVKKIKDYSKDPVFKKKADDAIAFYKKNGLPKTFTRKKDKD